jgi:hypothetical protein
MTAGPLLTQAAKATRRAALGASIIADLRTHGQRPMPSTAEEDIWWTLLSQMARARPGQVDLEALAGLARLIQQYGRSCYRVRTAAEALGLHPDWLPRRRE